MLPLPPEPLPPEPVLLRVDPAVGARNEYRMDVTMSAREDGEEVGGFDARFTLAERALKTDARTVEFRRFLRPETVVERGAKGHELAAVYRAIPTATLPTIVDRRGKTLSIGRGPEATASGTIDVVFPERAVLPGETWTGDYGSEGQIRVLCTLRGVAPVAGRRVALVAVADPPDAPRDAPYRIEPDSLFAFDLADGRWLRTRAAFTISPSPGKTLRVGYAIARAGAPEWREILAAFPTNGKG